jgi:hypothetical protein
MILNNLSSSNAAQVAFASWWKKLCWSRGKYSRYTSGGTVANSTNGDMVTLSLSAFCRSSINLQFCNQPAQWNSNAVHQEFGCRNPPLDIKYQNYVHFLHTGSASGGMGTMAASLAIFSGARLWFLCGDHPADVNDVALYIYLAARCVRIWEFKIESLNSPRQPTQHWFISRNLIVAGIRSIFLFHCWISFSIF